MKENAGDGTNEEALVNGSTTFGQLINAGIAQEDIENIIGSALPPTNQDRQGLLHRAGTYIFRNKGPAERAGGINHCKRGSKGPFLIFFKKMNGLSPLIRIYSEQEDLDWNNSCYRSKIYLPRLKSMQTW